MINSKPKYNILIVDDHPLIIEGYQNTINQISLTDSNFDFQSESATNIDEAVRKVEISIATDNTFDLILLDISLPGGESYGLQSGEFLGVYIKKLIPKIKVIVITSLDDSSRLINIFSNLKPEGFLIKTDISSLELLHAIKTVANDNSYFSQSIVTLLHKKTSKSFNLDDIDLNILTELANGSRMKDLQQIIPLTKSGIEKRKKNLKYKFKIFNNSDRDLVLKAKKKGYI